VQPDRLAAHCGGITHAKLPQYDDAAWGNLLIILW
jgi:hypothetical protein